MDGERMTMWSLFRDLSLVTPMSADQLKSFIATMDRMLAGSPQKPAGGLVAYLAARAKDEQKLRSARMRLVESGLIEANVNAFPPDQVILLDAARECQERFDEIAKTFKFPTLQFEEFTERYVAAKADHAYLAEELTPIPSLVRVRRASSPRAADCPPAACGGAAHARSRARGCATREALRCFRAAARRPVHGQALPV